MRFMMLLPAPPEVLEQVESRPSRDLVTDMRKYEDEMRRAGVLLLAEGLHPTSTGPRLKVIGAAEVLLAKTV